MRIHLSRFYVIALSMILAGCGPGKPTIVPTQGTVVTKDGKPCDGAFVVFHPQEKERINGRKPFAIAGEDGRFSLTTEAASDGAMVGDYGVTIVWPAKADAAKKEPEMSLTTSSEGSGGGKVGNGDDQLNGKYGNPKEPLIKVSIKKDSKDPLKFEVER